MYNFRACFCAVFVIGLALSEIRCETAPFVLPFDDDSRGVTNSASRLNHVPAGKFGRIEIDDDGHFQQAGERIRFFGVNVTTGSCFPPKEDAGKIARRLAKFGVNIVRFHHMDNFRKRVSVPSLIDYSIEHRLAFVEDNSDRLDYFVSALKANGIYVNFNLLNSRKLRASEGLHEEVEKLNKEQRHVLGFVYEPLRDKEKEYARELLTHVNPYTGLSYAEDPAIAFVEVNNENGIFRQYFDGSINRWPDVFNNLLRDKWNAWLRSKYSSTEELEVAWGAVEKSLGAELMTNGSFEDGMTDWTLGYYKGAEATSEIGVFEGKKAIRIEVTNPTLTGWHVQLIQVGRPIEAGQLYTIGFWARSEGSVHMTAHLQLGYKPWTILDYWRSLDLDSEWTYHETTFESSINEDNAQLGFSELGNQEAVLHIAEVSLRPGGSIGRLPKGQRLKEGSIEINYKGEGYPASRTRDWTRFLTSLANDYWPDMHRYIVDELAYGGLVTGSAIMNSPPNVQSEFPFADAHSYWTHPDFKGEWWGSEDWFVANESMVNTSDTTIADLANERIKGIPFTVSEYQHASPNLYSSEGPLLIAAYGALQDWDGIMLFNYDGTEGGSSWDNGYFNDYFSMNAHPTKMANMLIAANLFRRGDVSAAQGETTMKFSPEVELELLAFKGSAWDVANGDHLGLPPELALVERVSLDVGPEAEGLTEAPEVPSGPVYVSDTSELKWDRSLENEGVVTVDTDRTKSVIGFVEGRKVDLGEVIIGVGDTELDWATVSLSMQEGSFDAPEAGGSLLIVATGSTENTAMIWTDDSKTSVNRNWGKAPSLAEIVPATIELPFAPEATKAWALDERGQRANALEVSDADGKSRITLGGPNKTIWYEVEVVPNKE